MPIQWFDFVRSVRAMNTGVPSSTRAVLTAMATHADGHGVTYPGAELLVDETSLGLRTVKLARKRETYESLIEGEE